MMDSETNVVDTNVLVSANGRCTHADLECQLACAIAIEGIRSNEVVALDSTRLILAEYAGLCNHSGQPGVGDVFFKYVFDNQYTNERVRLFAIEEVDDPERGFRELPQNTLDRSDRKFLAVAIVANAIIINATDSDWFEEQDLIDSLSVEVRQLCPQHRKKP